MLVGKTGYGPSCKQDDINALMVSLAKAGRRVVRLKGGDPLIFWRAGEEIAACRAAGIAVEIVPGITAAQGAAAQPRRLADRIARTRGACSTSPATTATAACRRISTGRASPTRRRPPWSTCRRRRSPNSRPARSRRGSTRQRRQSRSRRRRGRAKQRSPRPYRRSPTSSQQAETRGPGAGADRPRDGECDAEHADPTRQHAVGCGHERSEAIPALTRD